METVGNALVLLRKEFAANYIAKDWISPEIAAGIVGVAVRTLRRWELAGVQLTRQSVGSYTRKYLRHEIEALATKRKKLKHERVMKRGGSKGTIRIPKSAFGVPVAQP